uniref:Putative secreted protein n=1 Tax=Ixodes ricinus TaxID=34613 RepID=A0A6B0U5D0_IXORI
MIRRNSVHSCFRGRGPLRACSSSLLAFPTPAFPAWVPLRSICKQQVPGANTAVVRVHLSCLRHLVVNYSFYGLCRTSIWRHSWRDNEVGTPFI